jgi:hypothetical protein
LEQAAQRGKVYKGDYRYFTVVIGGKKTTVSAYYSEEYVDQVTIPLDSPVPTDVILERYGPPCGISIAKPEPDRADTLIGAEIRWYYPGIAFLISLGYWESDRLSPNNMFAYQVTLEDPQAQNPSLPCTVGRYGDPFTIDSPWLGFTSYRRYQHSKLNTDTPK